VKHGRGDVDNYSGTDEEDEFASLDDDSNLGHNLSEESDDE
jgi:hypothetical protein